jgi:hypothetical protein
MTEGTRELLGDMLGVIELDRLADCRLKPLGNQNSASEKGETHHSDPDSAHRPAP